MPRFKARRPTTPTALVALPAAAAGPDVLEVRRRWAFAAAMTLLPTSVPTHVILANYLDDVLALT